MTTSLLSPWQRFATVFSSPREAYRDLANAWGKTQLWLIPVLFIVVISVLGIKLNGELYREMGRKAMEERFDKMVTDGKMTQEQADGAREKAEAFTGGGVFYYASGVVMPFVKIFVVATIFLLVVNFGMKGQISFADMMATLGVSEIISVLGALVSMLLVSATGSLSASLSPAIALGEMDPKNILQIILRHLDVFSLWSLGVFAIGISEVTGKAQRSALTWVFGIWAAWVLLTVLFSQVGAMFG